MSVGPYVAINGGQCPASVPPTKADRQTEDDPGRSGGRARATPRMATISISASESKVQLDSATRQRLIPIPENASADSA